MDHRPSSQFLRRLVAGVAVAACAAPLVVASMYGPGRTEVASLAPVADGPVPSPIERYFGFDSIASYDERVEAGFVRREALEQALAACPGYVPGAAGPLGRDFEARHDLVAPEYQRMLVDGYGHARSKESASALDAELETSVATAIDETCFGEVYARTQGPFDAAWDRVLDIREGVFQAVAATEPVRTASDAWAGCMSAAGRPFSDPAAIEAHLSHEFAQVSWGGPEADALAEEELTIASADVACRQTVVDPVYRPLLFAAEEQALVDHAELFGTAHQLLYGL